MAPDATLAAEAVGLGEHRFRSMGCAVSVLAPAERRDAGPRARQVIDAWDDRFSRFRSGSELEHLNDAGGRPFAVSPEMVAVVETALRAARASDGLFDPLLGGRLRELGYDRTFTELPSDRPHRPVSVWRSGGWREIVVDAARGTVQLPAGHRLDLGGIAKGMAVDAALATLVTEGMPFAAVNAGGDLAVFGLPPGQSWWNVAIDGPRPMVVAVREGALATSSVLRRRWRVAGTQRHHLIDPRTGMPAEGPIVQASVAAATCAAAEVAAKLAVLSDLPAAISLLESSRLAALLVGARGEAWRVGTWQ
jgi:thiamine biosynthesis lipoprotein